MWLEMLVLNRIKVAAYSLADAVQHIEEHVQGKRGGYFCFMGVHGASESFWNSRVHDAHSSATMVFPDGIPIVWTGRFLQLNSMEQIAGPVFIWRLLACAQKHQWRVFLFGSTPRALSLASTAIQRRLPGVIVCGTDSPPFGSLELWDVESISTSIQAASPDLVIVGLSTPKQELWMWRSEMLLGGITQFGLGAALDIVAGTQKDAPRVLRGSGFEWVYRLILNPRRLWRRYAKSIPTYLWLLLTRRAWRLEVPT